MVLTDSGFTEKVHLKVRKGQMCHLVWAEHEASWYIVFVEVHQAANSGAEAAP